MATRWNGRKHVITVIALNRENGAVASEYILAENGEIAMAEYQGQLGAEWQVIASINGKHHVLTPEMLVRDAQDIAKVMEETR